MLYLHIFPSAKPFFSKGRGAEEGRKGRGDRRAEGGWVTSNGTVTMKEKCFTVLFVEEKERTPRNECIYRMEANGEGEGGDGLRSTEKVKES